MALDRRESRSWTFGSGGATGVLRKNFIIENRRADARPSDPGRTPSLLHNINRRRLQKPDYLPGSEALGAEVDGAAEAAAATVPAPAWPF